MSCPKPNPLIIFLTNTAIVLATCLAVDFVVYQLVWPGVNPYKQDFMAKFIYTLVLAMAYGHLYNKVSYQWRPGSTKSFVYKGMNTPPGKECSPTWKKVANGMVFSLLASVSVYMLVSLSVLFVSIVYIYFFNGLHGDLRSTVGTSGSLVMAGIVLEFAGKTEDDPDM